MLRVGQHTIKPEIKRRIRHTFDLKPYLPQPSDDEIAFVPKMPLQRFHLVENLVRLQHWDGGLLEGHVSPAVEIGAAGADCFDEIFGADYPGDAPAGKPVFLN